MALTAFQSSSGSIRSELELVYMSLASLEWSRGDSRAAVGVLLACLNGSGPPSKTTTYTPTQLLKAQGEWTLKAFEGIQSLSKDSLTSPLPSGTWTNTLCRLYCSLLFEYLVSESIESVSDLGRRFLSLENVKKTIELQECLYELVARFLYAQVKSSSGFKPGLIRSWLEEGLSHFPENTILLSVYGWVESKAGIENRTRRYLDGLLSER